MDCQRVLHVMWSANPGGIARLVLNLCAYQNQNLISKAETLICKKDGPLRDEFIKSGIGIHELDLQSGMDLSPAKLNRCLQLMRLYDIIHLHIFHPAIFLSALLSTKKIIFTEHGNFGLGRNTGLSGRVIRNLKTKLLNRPKVTITCNSQFAARTLSTLNRIRYEKIVVVYNGVPEPGEHTGSIKFRKKEDKFLVVSIGRLAKVKRFDRVIEAFKKADLENSRLLIMGDGPEEDVLKTNALQHTQGPPVEFTRTGDSLTLLREADLCILGSQGEAFGLVAVEAYQAGKRVLVFEDGGGVTEIVSGMDLDAVCSDTNSLAEQIRITMQSGLFLHPDWAEKAKLRAADFSMKKMADAFNRLYHS
ncbi:MAG: hypothetical protein RLZZ630_808 [Bacteroidota bacterium]|jgi:glycosyltransferase involved in cell wall biosynthesis